MGKIIIVGYNGFIGSRVTARFVDSYRVYLGVDNFSFSDKANVPKHVPFFEQDFNDLTSKELSEFDTMIFVACSNIIYAMKEPIKTFENNTLNSIKLFDRFKGKIVYTSTASVYGQADSFPTPENAQNKVSNAYDQSKLIAELFLKQRGNYTTLRLSNVYGIGQRASNPYSGVIGKIISNALKNEPIVIYGDGLATRDFTFSEDVVDAIEQAVDQPAHNDCFNIATGKETNILTLAKLIIELTGSKSELNYQPKRSIDGINRRCLSIEKANYVLNWVPLTPLEKGLIQTIEWVKTTL